MTGAVSDPMTAVWLTLILLSVGTFVIKASGPVMLGGGELPAHVARIISFLVPALLGALVAHETFAHAHSALRVDARVAGLAVAAVALACRIPLIVVVVLAAAATAITRLLA